jgi:hypothetical protein
MTVLQAKDGPWRAKMPLRGRDHTFALANCRALLFKLEREIKRSRETDASGSAAAAEMTDLAFNISVTAWHLCDWVFEDMTADQREKLDIRKLSDLQKLALSHRPLHLCRQLATASKHWEVSQHPNPEAIGDKSFAVAVHGRLASRGAMNHRAEDCTQSVKSKPRLGRG